MPDQNNDAPQRVILDLGKQKSKRVRQLRKGKGKLMADVRAAVAELQDGGIIAAGAQPIVIIVERKPEGFGLPGMLVRMPSMR